MRAVISDQRLRVEGLNYFVHAAGSVTPGAWGEKMSAAEPGPRSGLKTMGVLPALWLSKVKFNATALVLRFSDDKAMPWLTALTLSGADFANGKVKLVKLSPVNDPTLIDQFNAAPEVISQLSVLGRSARLVVDVLLVMEAPLYSRFAAQAADLGIVYVEGGMRCAGRETGFDRSSDVSLGPGAIVGYSLARPCWRRVHDGGKPVLIALRRDNGVGPRRMKEPSGPRRNR